MARLPQPGSDNGTWGDILNEFLSQSLAPSGELKPESVGATQLQPNSVTADILAPNSVTNSAIAPNTITSTELASNAVTAAIIADGSITETLLDSSLQAKVNQVSPVSSVNTKTGAVTIDKTDIGLGNVDNTSDAVKNAASVTLTNKTINGLNNTLSNTFTLTTTGSSGAATYNGTTLNIPQYTSGDVTGPASSTDNTIVRFDGTTGKLIQNSGVIISDSSEIGVGTASKAGVSISANKPMELISTQPMGYETTIYGNGGQNVFRRANGTSDTPTAVMSGDTLGALSFRGYTGTAFTGSKAYIYAIANQTWTDAANGTYISIQTTPNNSTTLQTVALFSSAGQVQLPVQGSSGGLLIGGDTNFYRSAADVLKTDDNLIIGAPGTVAGSAVTIDSTQTLTNKTLDTPTIINTATMTNGGALVLYNTADQTTNYERLRIYYSSNVAIITSEAGGTGTARSLQIGLGFRSLTIAQTASSNGFFLFNGSTGGANATMTRIAGSFAATSGVNVGLEVSQTLSGSGTQGYTAFKVNPTDSSTGTGPRLLADFQSDGTSKTRIDNTGTHLLSSGAGITIYNTTDETTNYERGRLFWNANALTLATDIGGAGSNRSIAFNVAGANLLTVNAGIPKVGISAGSSGTGAIMLSVSGTHSGTGAQYGVSITPTINQSGAGAYTALLVNPLETATGSGTKLIADFQKASTSYLSIDNTGTMIKHSSATGGALTYNTSDETTNYERVREYWNSNVYTIVSEAGGTATKRTIDIVSGGTFRLAPSGNATSGGIYQFITGSTAADSIGVSVVGTYTSSNTTKIVNIAPTINQSGTAGYTALFINPTETATGSGAKLLIDAQVGGTSKFSVSTSGVVQANGANLISTSSTDTLTNKTLTSPRIGTAIYDTSANPIIALSPIASAVNYFTISNATTTNSPSILAVGADTNVGIYIRSKGTGGIVHADGSANPVLLVQPTASAVNYAIIRNSLTGTGPSVEATGTDTNIDLRLIAKGTGGIRFNSDGLLSSGKVFTSYNTADETINYERVRQYWSSNTFTFITESGGTGISRNMQIQAGSTAISLQGSGGVQVFRNNTGINYLLNVTSTGLTASSATQYGLTVNPTINQSGTAGYTTLLINPSEAATGSGARRLLDVQLGNTSKFYVQSDGGVLFQGAGDNAFNISNTITQTATGAVLGVSVVSNVNPAATSSAEVRAFNMSSQITNAQTHNIVRGGFLETRYMGSGSADTLTGGRAQVILPANSQNFGTINWAIGLETVGLVESASTAITAGTVTNAVGLRAVSNYKASAGLTLTNVYGIDVQSQTVGSVNVGVRIAKSNTYSLWMSDTGGTSAGGITFGTDTTLYRSAASTLKTDGSLAIGTSIKDTNGATILALNPATTAVNFLQLNNGAASGKPYLRAQGSDTNITMAFVPKGTGTIQLQDSNFATVFTTAAGVASAVNYTLAQNAASGSAPLLGAWGSDTNVDLNLAGKGTGIVKANGVEIVTISGTQTLTNKTFGDNLNMGSHRITSVTDPTSAQDAATKNYVDTNTVTATGTATLTNKTLTNPKVNQIQDTDGYDILGLYGIPNAVNKFYLTNQSTTNYPTLGVDGGDTNIGFSLAPKGNGTVRIYANTGITPTLDVGGPDTNIDLNLKGQGSGVVKVNGVPVATQVVTPPATATSTGMAGQIAYDGNYFYQCVATNTWKRTALASW